jgi:Holliday junction resolvase
MPNKNYIAGRRFEYSVKEYFQRKGFFVVRQAKSAFPDIVAIKGVRVLLVECKVNGYLRRGEKRALLNLARMHKIEPILAYRSRENGRISFKLIQDEGENPPYVPCDQLGLLVRASSLDDR